MCSDKRHKDGHLSPAKWPSGRSQSTRADFFLRFSKLTETIKDKHRHFAYPIDRTSNDTLIHMVFPRISILYSTVIDLVDIIKDAFVLAYSYPSIHSGGIITIKSFIVVKF